MSASLSPVAFSGASNAHDRAPFLRRAVRLFFRACFSDGDHILLPHSKHAALCALLDRAGYKPNPKYGGRAR